MIIKVLVENTTNSEDFVAAHGLSLNIQTSEHNILFDAGPGEQFLENAEKIGVNIEDIDIFVLSHGHYDHGGGLSTFLKNNSKAKIFVHRFAFEPHYALRAENKWDDIGLNPDLKENDRMMWTAERHSIDKGVHVFSNVMHTHSTPASNQNLYMECADQMAQDSFEHEQNLIIEENGVSVLFTGCAHNGIINIIEQYFYTMGKMPDYVVGGFHLSSQAKNNDEDMHSIKQLGHYFMSSQARYYTGHCTGQEAYEQLKEIMGDHIEYASTGSEIKI